MYLTLHWTTQRGVTFKFVCHLQPTQALFYLYYFICIVFSGQYIPPWGEAPGRNSNPERGRSSGWDTAHKTTKPPNIKQKLIQLYNKPYLLRETILIKKNSHSTLFHTTQSQTQSRIKQRIVRLSVVSNSTELDSALYQTAQSQTQRCIKQHRVRLSVVSNTTESD